MAALVIKNFGGMAPSANPKTLNDPLGVLASNLNLRFGDFRPLPQAEVTGPAMTPGQTLYRFQNMGWFITNPNQASYVRGPIPNDTLERTYYTGDGSPKVVDQTNDVRVLGVPQPASAPVASVIVNDEYAEEDEAGALAAAQHAFSSHVGENANRPLVGLADLGPLEATAISGTYRFPIAGAIVSGAFVPTNPAHRNLMSDSLGFYLEEALTTTVGYVEINVRSAKLEFDASLAADLATIKDPSDGVSQLIPSESITKAITALNEGLAAANTAQAVQAGKITKLASEFIASSNSGTASLAANAGAVSAFYARADVTDAIDKAIERAVYTIRAALRTYNRNGPSV